MSKYIVKADIMEGGVIRNTPRTKNYRTGWRATDSC